MNKKKFFGTREREGGIQKERDTYTHIQRERGRGRRRQRQRQTSTIKLRDLAGHISAFPQFQHSEYKGRKTTVNLRKALEIQGI